MLIGAGVGGVSALTADAASLSYTEKTELGQAPASPLTLEEVSRNAGVSKYYFVRVFHEVTGESFVKYLNKVRCDYAKQLLLNSDKPISRICEECGFFAPSYFSRTFKKYVGVLPSEYRANCNSVK